MAICGGCGAASAEGATRCAACGQSLAIGEVEFGGGGLNAPQQEGSWGAGVVVEAKPRPAVLRWFTEADWRPALRAVAAPTALLLVVALLLSFGLAGERGTLGFGTRFGVALAVVLTAFGGPVGSRMEIGDEKFSSALVNQMWVLPMTVTLLWAVLFGYGLRAARRRLAPEPTIRRLLAEAGRPVLLTVVVTAALGLLAGVEHHNSGRREELGGPMDWLFQFAFADHVTVSVGTAWSALGSAVLATALAAGVYGADRLRGALGDWTASAAAAARALSLTVALATVVALVLTASLMPLEVTLLGLLVLPNLGLNLLGFGSGATAGLWQERSGPAEFDLRDELDQNFSLFDLAGQTGHWRWTVLLALAAALLLGRAVRRLDLAGRIRAAGFYWIGASLLMLLSGMTQWSGADLRGTAGEAFGIDPAEPVGAQASIGLALLSVLAANLVWTAVGAFAVPLLFRREPLPLPVLPPEAPSVVPPQPTHVPFAGEVLDSHTTDR
ncbi:MULTISPECIES: hypothetical protein [unclassified Kitasatospora]|uniref:hypothetical protein n=1 Tax=unclassified Kitasatospora TaxID=2633591 RepID=UPI000A80E550|nr:MULTISPECIES: hypothetical protein [unclassified Kitasatospora]